MYKLVILLVVFHVSFAPPVAKIVNGTDAVEGEIPYIISLRFGGSHNCGGSILNEYYVLTAAHCVSGAQPSDLFVQYGILQLDSTSNIIAVGEITSHPDYIPGGGWINDLAIVKLVSPIMFSDTVQPVALPSQGYVADDWSNAILAGWGLPYTGGTVTNDLQRVDILVYPDDVCETSHDGTTSREYHLCAGVPEGGKGQCNGDSGGPLTVNGVQLGIVSWSVKPCTVVGFPGVFSRVANYVDWINEQSQL